jgi:hypothetical protein
MNALLPLFAADVGDHKTANLLAAARALTPQLNRSRPLDRKLVANVMTMAFGASDAEGAWLWRDAYDAIEAALVLQIRRLAPQVGRLEDAPAEIVALLANLADLSLTHTRRSEEQVAHLHAALDCLADGGRLSAIVPARLFEDAPALRALAARGPIRLRLAFPARAYAKHGTSVETGLLVIDRGTPGGEIPAVVVADTLADAAQSAAAIEARATAQPRQFRTVSQVSVLAPRARALATPSNRLAFLAASASLAYEACAWSGEGHDVGLYQAYALGRIRFPASRPHPSPLVESGPMASVAPPAPTYRPVLPIRITDDALVSDAQMETVIYAGEAHAQVLPGSWILGDAPHQVILVKDDHPGAVSFRKGFFLGDGTGCGKGREIAGVIADNLAQGRSRAVWLSKNDALLEDARRDWSAIGGANGDITPQSAWKQADAIRMDRGILFSTYATLRQPARGDRRSRLDQIVDWLGADFDGVIVFDEAHAMANAAGGGKGARGAKKPSQQGMAGLALQNRLPNARILYVSATGATTRRTSPTPRGWASGAGRKRPSPPATPSWMRSRPAAWR